MRVGRNSIFNIAGAVIPLILALATIPLYLALIGPERYGVLAIASMVLGYFGMFDLGLGPATARRISMLHDSTPDHRARVFWTAMAVNAAIGAIGALVLYAGTYFFFLYAFKADAALVEEAVAALPYLALGVPVATLTGVARGALQGSDRFLELNLATIVGGVLIQLLPLGMAYAFTLDLKWLIIAAVVARMLTFLLVLSRVHLRLLVGLRPSFDRAEWRALLSFGGWVSITTMISPMMVAADRLLIGALLGASAAAIYAVAFDLSRRISLVPNAVGVAAFPKFARDGSAPNQQLMTRSMETIDLVMSAPVVAGMFLIGPFLTFWLGAELGQQAIVPAQILMIAYWGNAFAVIPFVRIQAEGRPDIVTKATLAQAPLLVIAIYFAIDAYGLAGAAIAVAARCIFEVVILLFLVSGKLTLPRGFITNLLIISVACPLSSQVSVFAPTGFGLMLVCTAITLASSWFLTSPATHEDLRRTFARFVWRRA